MCVCNFAESVFLYFTIFPTTGLANYYQAQCEKRDRENAEEHTKRLCSLVWNCGGEWRVEYHHHQQRCLCKRRRETVGQIQREREREQTSDAWAQENRRVRWQEQRNEKRNKTCCAEHCCSLVAVYTSTRSHRRFCCSIFSSFSSSDHQLQLPCFSLHNWISHRSSHLASKRQPPPFPLLLPLPPVNFCRRIHPRFPLPLQLYLYCFHLPLHSLCIIIITIILNCTEVIAHLNFYYIIIIICHFLLLLLLLCVFWLLFTDASAAVVLAHKNAEEFFTRKTSTMLMCTVHQTQIACMNNY